MKNVSFVLAGMALACSYALAAAPARSAAPPSVNAPTVRSAIDAAVENDRRAYGGNAPIPGVLIGVWDGHGGSYVRGFGYADLAKQRPLSPADHFRIGSNTKTFVVAVILQLADEGKLSLDDPVSKFDLGIKIPNASTITVRQLCDMRSGLFEIYDTPQFEKLDFTPQTKFDVKTMIDWAGAQKPYFPPNKGYHYSNTGYLILGMIVEKVTGNSVGSEIRTRLLVPFGLTHTSYPDTQAMPEPWAHGYGLDAHKNWEDVSGIVPVSGMGAAGLMISDMRDMKRWIELYVGGKTTTAAGYRALMNCLPVGAGDLAFGMGLGCSAGWFGYTGGLPGYNTANYVFPDNGAFILAWVDVQANDPKPGAANAMIRDIAKVLTPDNVPFLLGGRL